MKEEAKKWIKGNGLLIKNVVFKKDEPILSQEQYSKLYKPSCGSMSGDGYCLFFTAQSFDKGNLHMLPIDVDNEIFKIDNMPV